jgi:hypothetical protein
MAKGDAAKARAEAEKISEELRDTFTEDFFSCILGNDNDAFFIAIENVLADATCLLPDEAKLTVFSSIFYNASHKAQETKRYKKIDRLFNIMMEGKEQLNG